MSYTKTGGQTWGDETADYAIRFNVLKAQNPSTSKLDTVYDGLVQAVDRIYHNTAIPGAFVRKYTTDQEFTCSNKIDDGQNWLDNNGFTSRGCHLWVYLCNDSVGYEGAWENRRQAFVDADAYSGDKLANVGVQEALHTYILHPTCDYVVNEAGNSDSEGEHALGCITKDSEAPTTDLITPMVTTYEDTWSSTGNCNDNDLSNNWGQFVTDCTVDSMYYSMDHAQNNGSH